MPTIFTGCWETVLSEISKNYKVYSAYFFVNCCIQFISLFFTLGIFLIVRKNNLEVIYIKKDALPESFPNTFGPNIDSRYVLEVVSGFADKNNLKVGDRVKFIY